MITEIQMSNVASFRASTSLTSDKKINLIYGLNGTGKSTVSDFLCSPTDPKFAHCQIVPTPTDAILVYNQSFIRDNFYESDCLKGIFSLSKENKAAEEKISKAQKQLSILDKSLAKKQDEMAAVTTGFEKLKQNAVDEIWKIKTSYCGGDRVLEYCLEGLKGQKEKLFSHVLSLVKPSEEPKITIPQLRNDVDALKNASAQPQDELPQLTFAQHAIESHTLLTKAIVGNADSAVAGLIERLNNSDWVKEGIQYLPTEIDDRGSLCPFCQGRTITSALVKNIKEYFDDAYTRDLSALEKLENLYCVALENISGVAEYANNAFTGDSKAEIENLHRDCVLCLQGNVRTIQNKIKNPRTEAVLQDSQPAFKVFNEALDRVNARIRQHNTKIARRAASLEALKVQFWELMRWQYDQTISRYLRDKEDADAKMAVMNTEKDSIDKEIAAQKEIISSAQKETVNIDQAVENINTGLRDLGIEDFTIRKHSDSLYRIGRHNQLEDAFHTLRGREDDHQLSLLL